MMGRRGFSVLEVLVSIAVLALLTAALMAFGLGLGERRDRLVREGERAAVLSRVFERLERAALVTPGPVRSGEDWVEVPGRGVWPSLEEGQGPIGPSDFVGRLSYSAVDRELVWQETGGGGQSFELRATDIEAVRVDRFEDLAVAGGSTPPLRVRVWLRPIGLPQDPDDSLAGVPLEGGPEAVPMPAEPVGRPADFVRTVGIGRSTDGAPDAGPDGGAWR